MSHCAANATLKNKKTQARPDPKSFFITNIASFNFKSNTYEKNPVFIFYLNPYDESNK